MLEMDVIGILMSRAVPTAPVVVVVCTAYTYGTDMDFAPNSVPAREGSCLRRSP